MIVGVLRVGKQWPGQKLVMERGQEDLCESTVDQLRGNRVVKRRNFRGYLVKYSVSTSSHGKLSCMSSNRKVY